LDNPAVGFGGGWLLPLLPAVRADEEPNGEEAPDVGGSAAAFLVPQREQNFAVGFMKAAPQFKQVGVADDIASIPVFCVRACCCCYGRGVSHNIYDRGYHTLYFSLLRCLFNPFDDERRSFLMKLGGLRESSN